MRNLLQVVAQQRPGGQLQGGKERVLGLVPPVGGEVGNADLAERREGGGRGGARSEQDGRPRAEGSNRLYLGWAARVAWSRHQQGGRLGAQLAGAEPTPGREPGGGRRGDCHRAP